MEKSISQPLPTRLLLILEDTAQRMWSNIKPSPVSMTLLNTTAPITLTILRLSWNYFLWYMCPAPYHKLFKRKDCANRWEPTQCLVPHLHSINAGWMLMTCCAVWLLVTLTLKLSSPPEIEWLKSWRKIQWIVVIKKDTCFPPQQ